MRLLVNELEASAPRPRSPHMNNEEPINLSHYPDGKKPEDESAPRPIERDDFPGEADGQHTTVLCLLVDYHQADRHSVNRAFTPSFDWQLIEDTF